MKHKISLFILPLIISLSSCQSLANAEVKEANMALSALDKSTILNSLNENVNISITGNLSKTYPDSYSYLNTKKAIDVTRDYYLIKETDGTTTPSIRDYDGNIYSTYYKNKTGLAVSEAFTPNNTITRINVEHLRQNVVYNEYYANPFTYVDEEDISDEGYLDPVKAADLVSLLTGYKRYISEAKFTVSEGKATKLSLTIPDVTEILATSSDENDIQGEEVINSLSLSVAFSYDVTPITHLSPRSLADSVIDSAIKNEDNYTVSFFSASSTSTARIYVTEKSVFVHNSLSFRGPFDGDMYYLKNDDGTYTSYLYSFSGNSFNIQDLSVKRSSFLPNLDNISPEVFLKESEGVYVLDSLAAPYVAEKLVIPQFDITTGEGLKASVTVKDNHLSSLKATFNTNLKYTVDQVYSDYGTTAMPSWLDESFAE